MMFPEKMNKIHIEVMKTDIDRVLRYLGRKGCLQLIEEKKEEAGAYKPENVLEREIYDVRLKLENLVKTFAIDVEAEADEQLPAATRDLSLEERVDLLYSYNSAAELPAEINSPPDGGTAATVLPANTARPVEAALSAKSRTENPQQEELKRQFLLAKAEEILAQAQELSDRILTLEQKQEKLVQTLDDLKAFSSLNVALSELDNLTFLNIRLGSIKPAHFSELTAALAQRAMLIPLEKPGYLIAVSTRKGKWALDTELNKFGFEPFALAPDVKGLPSSVFAAVTRELELINQQLGELQVLKENFKLENERKIALLVLIFRQLAAIDKVKQALVCTQSVYQISGWIPAKEINTVIGDLDTLTAGRIAVQSFDPREIAEVRVGKVKVPVKLKRRKFMQPFERLIFAYAAPLYGTIDPTPFVAFFFILLFAIMFGDLGQGFVGLLIGLMLQRGHYRGSLAFLNKWQKFGIVFIIVGIASMITGFLYGSVFTNEEILVPVTRTITRALFGEPMDRFVTLLPTHGIDQVLAFFGFTLAIGAIINSIGLIINIINKFIRGNPFEAIFSKVGLSGALFFWYILFMVVRAVAGGGVFFTFDLVFLILPLFLIFFREPIFHLFTGKRPLLHGSLVGLIMEGIIELLESISYYFSNSLSFVRVAAFALSHTVLSFIVFRLGDMLAESATGLAGQITILVIGNLLIILLEGLIIAIQVVRLQYYEFFSKFFTETGVEFKPFLLV